MKFKIIKWVSIPLLFMMVLFISELRQGNHSVYAQQPTGSIPTVTGTPNGPTASIKAGASEGSVWIRSGPGTLYLEVGVMIIGDSVPVKGKSPGGAWLLIEYPGIPGGRGWVYSGYMDITAGEIPIAEVPAPAQPKVTITIDPTLASQFLTTPLATLLPTYTPSAPLEIPTFENQSPQIFAGIPIGLIIFVIFGLGILIALFSYFQAR
ncbi:MAG: hypothetical protein NTZ74_06625 [Chloroflexi bacterium]|nr:hypothetical protein [Chloroflexota bacterium]